VGGDKAAAFAVFSCIEITRAFACPTQTSLNTDTRGIAPHSARARARARAAAHAARDTGRGFASLYKGFYLGDERLAIRVGHLDGLVRLVQQISQVRHHGPVRVHLGIQNTQSSLHFDFHCVQGYLLLVIQNLPNLGLLSAPRRKW
jgi:hypothetical protein